MGGGQWAATPAGYSGGHTRSSDRMLEWTLEQNEEKPSLETPEGAGTDGRMSEGRILLQCLYLAVPFWSLTHSGGLCLGPGQGSLALVVQMRPGSFFLTSLSQPSFSFSLQGLTAVSSPYPPIPRHLHASCSHCEWQDVRETGWQGRGEA